MKLSYEDKVKIYEMRKSGVTWSQIHDQFGVNTNNLRYMFRLIERHGIEIIKKTTNRHYPPELKQEIIDKVLIEGYSQGSVSLDYALPNMGTLPNWIAQYKKTGILLLRNNEGDQQWDVNLKRSLKR